MKKTILSIFIAASLLLVATAPRAQTVSLSLEALPLSVSPNIATPGQTITINAKGFKEGARALVWGGKLPFVFVKRPFLASEKLFAMALTENFL